MMDPLKSLDRWASQSVERATLVLWLAIIAMAMLVVLAVVALYWFTAPLPRAG